MYSVYTDGSCLGNPGPGGWAAVIVGENLKWTIQGRESDTTNNRMEVLAVIKGLGDLKRGSRAVVYSDSQYLINTMTLGWKRRSNNDLWKRLDLVVSDLEVAWKWVKGHSGLAENEEADKLAVEQASLVTSTDNLSHLDTHGNAHMVDVGSKDVTQREAIAQGFVSMSAETLSSVANISLEKGDVLACARIAGIMAAKKTSGLIPLCHIIPLNYISVDFDQDFERNGINITAIVRAYGKTGVEMEALLAVSIAALTIYDMCKSVEKAISIDSIRLLKKSGGKSGDFVLEE
jgi:cyclic pyranopterin phosphate synthase